MISAQTAIDIALAHQEIERGEKLLADVEEVIAKRRGREDGACLRDAFGRRTDGLQLGVPSGDNGQRLFNVPWELARPVIQAHIAGQRALVVALNETARLQLSEPAHD